MKTTFLRNKITKLLAGGAMTTSQLYEEINKGKYGTTMQTLSNVLHKHPDFEKIGREKVPYGGLGASVICVWRLKE